jgi:hypothetical protein
LSATNQIIAGTVDITRKGIIKANVTPEIKMTGVRLKLPRNPTRNARIRYETVILLYRLRMKIFRSLIFRSIYDLKSEVIKYMRDNNKIEKYEVTANEFKLKKLILEVQAKSNNL